MESARTPFSPPGVYMCDPNFFELHSVINILNGVAPAVQIV